MGVFSANEGDLLFLEARQFTKGQIKRSWQSEEVLDSFSEAMLIPTLGSSSPGIWCRL